MTRKMKRGFDRKTDMGETKKNIFWVWRDYQDRDKFLHKKAFLDKRVERLTKN